MTLGSLLLTLLAAYLALVAFGAVRARRKFAGAPLRVVQAALVLIVPAVLAAGLFAGGDGAVVQEWGKLFAAMPVLGLITLILADRIAAQVNE